MKNNINDYQVIQRAAIEVLHDIQDFLSPGVSEIEVAKNCAGLLSKRGVSKSWYHEVPALVLVGERTSISISGKDYHPSSIEISQTDLITIDLSPERNGCWGDCARSFVIENGNLTTQPQDQELAAGLKAEEMLHKFLVETANPSMTVHELYIRCSEKIRDIGFENLDFLGNLGHSIEYKIDERRFIESDSMTRLGDLKLFTFEPHIRFVNGKWGFKHENIYFFSDGLLHTLK